MPKQSELRLSLSWLLLQQHALEVGCVALLRNWNVDWIFYTQTHTQFTDVLSFL